MPLTPGQAADQARLLRRQQQEDRQLYDKALSYRDGIQALPAVIPSSAPAEVRRMGRISRVNICKLVVDTLAQSLFVDGFRGADDPDNAQVWSIWQQNKMDARQGETHRQALTYGRSYVVVLPGEPGPVFRRVSPRSMTTVFGEDPDWPMWALERIDRQTYRLYDDEAVYFLGNNERGRMDWIDTRTHGMGVCPVVRFLDEMTTDENDPPGGFDNRWLTEGQIAPLVPLQDQIDLTTFNLLVAQHYGAFKQRYILGWIAEDEKQKMHAAASRIWTFEDHPDDMEIGELSETNLDGYIKSREASLRHAATLSQTPAHELIGELVNLSAEALAAAEAGRDRKVDERKALYGESWEQVLWAAGRIAGAQVPEDAEVVWRDTSARAFSATVDALQKLKDLGVPVPMLFEMIPGWTQQHVERARTLAEGGDPLTFFTEVLEAQMGEEVPVG